MVRYKFWIFKSVLLVLIAVILAGCGGDGATTDLARLAEFTIAGPLMPELDYAELNRSQAVTGNYTINPGDVLKVQMPWELRQVSVSAISESASLDSVFLVRVGSDGFIVMPVIGKVNAAGDTLEQLEANIIDLYYPKYTNVIPTIVVTVERLKTNRVTIAGAVNVPGVYELPANRTTLISLLMESGGIIDSGASVIRITFPEGAEELKKQIPVEMRADFNYRIHILADKDLPDRIVFELYRFENLIESSKVKIGDPVQIAAYSRAVSNKYEGLDENVLIRVLSTAKPGDIIDVSDYIASNEQIADYILLPIQGLHIPFTDLSLTENCMVEVLPLNPQIFSVFGLVNRSGAFAYPPNVRYNLLQALSMAGGTDMVAKPKYARIYRQKSDGQIIDVTFEIAGVGPFAASSVEIKPGDVIAVEPTFETSMNQFVGTLFRVNIGAYYRVNDE